MPDNNFDIDDFKSVWQEDRPAGYADSDIRRMLNRRSRNYVRYILYISLAELALFILLNLYTYIGQENNSFMSILSRLGAEENESVNNSIELLYDFLKIGGLLLTLVFIVLFYRSYKRISVESNMKKFILQIIRFKKTVSAFIWANILWMVISVIALATVVVNTLSRQHITPERPTILGFFVGVTIAALIGIGFMLLYYRVVYGIILRRLNRNLKQLQEIENE